MVRSHKKDCDHAFGEAKRERMRTRLRSEEGDAERLMPGIPSPAGKAVMKLGIDTSAAVLSRKSRRLYGVSDLLEAGVPHNHSL
jgi:hypothetical protein